jgi:hypothetical protein
MRAAIVFGLGLAIEGGPPQHTDAVMPAQLCAVERWSTPEALRKTLTCCRTRRP